VSDQSRDSLVGKRVAIANRGEIAVRIAATCQRLGAIPVLLLGDPDLDGFAARQVGRIERVGEAGSELDVARVVSAALRANAALLHPGYGFLSERADFAEACQEAGIRFVGPSPETLRLCGDKLATRAAAVRAGVPVLPASPPLTDDAQMSIAAAREIGYPLLVKPSEAGGGRGLRLIATEAELIDAIAASRRESGPVGELYLERALIAPRHIEVQVIGDGQTARALGDRDCSIQRRHQKVIEEAPAPNINDALRAELHDYARRISEEVGLHGIATCEFLLDQDGTLAFLEVNPRIQVEHPVTELVTGMDLVECQLRLAAGQALPVDSVKSRGHAIEARVYAEDPANRFLPSAGKLEVVSWPVLPTVRVDSGYASGDVMPSSYDPMLAKIVAHGADRESALEGLRTALRRTIVAGLPTNLTWLLDLLNAEAVKAGRATTQTASDVSQTIPDHNLAVAAGIAHTLDRSRGAASDPWTAIGPLRLTGAATVAFHGDDWEELRGIRQIASEWLLESDGEASPLRWWRDEKGIWTINLDDEIGMYAIVARNDMIEVAGNGGRWVMGSGRLPTETSTRQQRTTDGLVRAPLPAKVMLIHTSPGDHVEQGQPLVTLSAMKIELVCDAPATGTVETISCEVDQLVDAGVVLVKLALDSNSQT
jgi:acetyl-CoA/propionyl-CoA carboxylase, biotin carboxylase, biotin carboxyl carrier protein